jgi:hypothetical protein
LSGSAIFLKRVASQPETISGAKPSSIAGSTKSSNQAKNNFGRLTSARRLPAMAKRERCLVLEASSLTSPRLPLLIWFLVVATLYVPMIWRF